MLTKVAERMCRIVTSKFGKKENLLGQMIDCSFYYSWSREAPNLVHMQLQKIECLCIRVPLNQHIAEISSYNHCIIHMLCLTIILTVLTKMVELICQIKTISNLIKKKFCLVRWWTVHSTTIAGHRKHPTIVHMQFHKRECICKMHQGTA